MMFISFPFASPIKRQVARCPACAFFCFLDLWSVDPYHTAGVMSFILFNIPGWMDAFALMHIGGQYFSPKETLNLGHVTVSCLSSSYQIEITSRREGGRKTSRLKLFGRPDQSAMLSCRTISYSIRSFSPRIVSGPKSAYLLGSHY